MDPDVMMYIAQKALILTNGEVLVLIDPIEGLDFPGGKIQTGEAVVKSLKREVKEEVGLEIGVRKPFYTKVDTFPVGHQLSGKGAFVVAYKCDYVSGEVTLSHEHTHYKWVTQDTYKTVDDGSWFFAILKMYFGG